MTDFAAHIAGAQDLTDEEQKKAGAPVAGAIDEEHRTFLQTIKKLIDNGEIDVNNPTSLLKEEVYATLDEAWKEKADLALANCADQLRHIVAFMESAETPNESPQLQTMVEQLWQSKQQIELHHDVFKF